MKAFFASVLLLAAYAFSTSLVAQDPPEMPKPTAEHKWLSKFHGTWTSKSKGMMGPGQPEMECSGEIVCKPLGEFWIVNDMQGDAFVTSKMLGPDGKWVTFMSGVAKKKK